MKMIVDNDDWIELIIKVPGKACNMSCEYCYEKKRHYDNTYTISSATLAALLKIMDGRPISVQLHGGEPLLIGLEKMQSLLETLKQYSGPIKVNIQTNGYLLDESWLEMFNSVYPGLELGLSLDGDPLSNSYRKDLSGCTTNKQIEHALKLCEKYGRNIGIISVVNRRSINRAKEILTYFSTFPTVKVINFTPCYDLKIVESSNEEYFIEPQEYLDFIKELSTCWIEKGFFRNFIIDPLFSVMCSLKGAHTSLCHFNQYKCAHIFTVYPDGTIGGCDELPYKFGVYARIDELSSFTDLLKKQQMHPIFKKIKVLNEKCLNCEYEDFCMRGCIGSRYNYSLSNSEHIYCKTRVELIKFVQQLIEQDKR